MTSQHNPNAYKPDNMFIFSIVGGALLAGCFSDHFGRLFIIDTGVALFTYGARESCVKTTVLEARLFTDL